MLRPPFYFNFLGGRKGEKGAFTHNALRHVCAAGGCVKIPAGLFCDVRG